MAGRRRPVRESLAFFRTRGSLVPRVFYGLYGTAAFRRLRRHTIADEQIAPRLLGWTESAENEEKEDV